MSFLSRLKQGLSKSTQKLVGGISDIITKRKLDDEALEELEDLLITADVGVEASARIIAEFRSQRFGKEVTDEEVRNSLAESISSILRPYALRLEPDFSCIPQVVLMAGVNGNGKTTTLGKLANIYRQQGRKVLIAACDTFRAAAVEQLQEWARRSSCDIVTGAEASDPASVAYQAMEKAKREGYDLLLIDTAGRLQNKKGLMEELTKIKRVITKTDESAPHHILLVLDATTGQNAHSQVESFREAVDISGLIVTKLDGTARAGVVIALAEKFRIPIYAIGVGEAIEDLRNFDADEFARSMMGI